MINYNVRFENLQERFQDLIMGECSLFREKLSIDELYTAALIGLLYADKTYEKGLSDFSTHVQYTVHQALKLCIANSYAQKSYYSLNRKITGTNGEIEFIAFFKVPTEDLDLHIMVSEFIAGLKGLSKIIAREILGNASIEEIMFDYHVSEKEIEQACADMRREWEMRFHLLK